ncbi:AAA family ATPase [Thermococcus sp.]|uniref:MinD/ParA family ATP-binding protein n=1 Tax=Thermococcus sp. TaxID=35749 RepID=UPI00261BC4F1|nr:AAA family ATPase [Thermococcus sp.]
MVSIVVTGRGGAGKTTVTANLGTYFSGLGLSTLLIDGDVYLPKLAFQFGMEDRSVSLHDLLKNPELNVREALYHDSLSGVDVVPGSSSIYDVLDTEQGTLRDIVSSLQVGYQLTIIDSPIGIPFDTIPTFRLADYQLIVVELERSPMHSVKRMLENEVVKLKELGEAYGLSVGVMINKVRESLDDSDEIVKYIEGKLGLPVVGIVPFDPWVPESTNYGRPLLSWYPGSPASMALSEMGEILDEWIFGSVKKSRWEKFREAFSSLLPRGTTKYL